MKKLRIITGIVWAFLGLILIIVLFPGLTGLSSSLAKFPFMKIHPRYSGGEVVKRIVNESCTLDVRQPVFKGLISERKNGFVQIDWRGVVPEEIRDTIDYDSDGRKDFIIIVDTRKQKTQLMSLDSKVKDLQISTPASYGWAARVNLTH
jgi:hypothetical protein